MIYYYKNKKLSSACRIEERSPHIKSIGDAYLITFLSPTDAMLCSMALQDAMHGHNLNVTEEEKIHIRVAANLGEVRVAKNDIFGEPVNSSYLLI